MARCTAPLSWEKKKRQIVFIKSVCKKLTIQRGTIGDRRDKTEGGGGLPALTSTDEDGTRLDLEDMMCLLRGEVQVERGIGRWSSGLGKERRSGGSLRRGKVERVGVCKVRW
jgi:hypothetical protein